MKSIIAITATLFLAASAVPVERAPVTARIALDNYSTSARGSIEIPLDGTAYQIYQQWKDTPINDSGYITVNTATITDGYDYKPLCVMRNEQGMEIARLTSDKDMVQFGPSPDQPEALVLNRATIVCSRAA